MASREEIENQRQRLEIHRRNLVHYLRQSAHFGAALVPAFLTNEIDKERANIGHIKQILRDWGEAVEDLPYDVENRDNEAATTSTEEDIQMSEEERKHITDLIAAHSRRLHSLEKQQAVFGIESPPHIFIEIDDIREKLRELQERLDSLTTKPKQKAPPPKPGNTPRPGRNNRDQIFISYSHADKRWLDRLMIHLKPLVRDSNLRVWNDTMIDPGANWKSEIDRALQATKVALLLVSADFLASDFIAHNELPPLLQAAQEEGAKIMPLIIGHCRFTHYPDLSRFQAVNSPSQPLADMPKARREAFLVKLSEAVEKAL